MPQTKTSAASCLRSGIFEDLTQLFRQSSQSGITRERSELGRCSNKALAGFRIGNHVIEGDAARADVTDGRGDTNQIVVSRCGMKAYARFDNRQRHVLALQLGVGRAKGADELGASNLT